MRGRSALAKPGPFSVDHFNEWAKRLELDNDEPWLVEDYFADFVADVFAGFSQCWLLLPEGNAKTTNLAGLALYHCAHRPNAFVPWAASARDQAEIGYTQAKIFVRSMRGEVPRCFDGYRRVTFPNGSRIQIFAAGSEHADGVIPTMPIIDELHRQTLELYRTWAGKLLKRGGQLLAGSTAGAPGSEFEETRALIKAQATDVSLDGGFLRAATERVVMHEYAVRDDRFDDMVAVKAANPFSGITVESLAEKRDDPTMTDSHWKRFTCNVAAQTDTDLFIDLTDWDRLADGELIEQDAVVCLGADGSRTWDTTVVAWATALEERIDVACHVFSVRRDVAHHTLHTGGKVDFDDVEQFLIGLFDRFRPIETAYDPRYLERSMELVDVRLPSASIIAVEPASKHARDAYQALFEAVASGRLRHHGDPVIAAHLANCTVERDERTREIRRLRKIDKRKPIDAVPALALAVWRATLAQVSVYETRAAVAV